MDNRQLGTQHITLTGEASVFVQPDQVVVTFGIDTFHKELQQVKVINDQLSEGFVKALKTLGIEESSIQTQAMSLDIVYSSPNPHFYSGSCSSIGSEIQGYSSRRLYVVTLKNISILDSLLDVGLTSGANRLLGVVYKQTNLRKYRDEARKLAARAAREKAELYATELGVKVGKAVSIEETPSFSPMTNQNVMAYGNSTSSGEQTTLVGQMEISASVTVKFSIE